MARVLLFGGTGTIGRATARTLVESGHVPVCVVRAATDALPAGAQMHVADVSDPESLKRQLADVEVDAAISCLASRTGAPGDAWAIDHHANLNCLNAAMQAGARHFILLSAICVQKPALEFQRAKLAFEAALIACGLTYSIVRPTAFFKSLSGQLKRLQAGKPFLVFGDGALTSCKPMSDADVGRYLVACLSDRDKHNAILPIGGPGEALTPLEQGRLLFEAVGKPAKFKHVPVGLLDAIIAVLGGLGKVFPKLKAKAELAKIGRYYATQSMLVWNADTERYDAELTPSFGSDTLKAHYEKLARGQVGDDRADHAVF